ncbi:MAG: hypothetical protein VKI82_06050 [Leptolyngbya sp.]|nr:hypothetical protein [Leptolyngbya sp.]
MSILMSDKTGLISLGTLAAVALLLTPLARADAQVIPLEPSPEAALDQVPEGAEGRSEDGAPAVPSADWWPSESPTTDSPPGSDSPLVESAPLGANPGPNLNDTAPTEHFQPPASTSSQDLLWTEMSVASEDLLEAPLAPSLDRAQTASASSQGDKWHFLLAPYAYVPLSISGSANFSNLNDDPGGSGGGIDFDLQPNQIRTALRNNLNFAFLGGFEAWNPNYRLGVLANFDYVSLSTNSTVNRDVRFPGAAAFIPTQVNTRLTTQLMRADLVGSYRFYDPAQVNPAGIDSEYDLGPFVFDALGGLSLIQVNTRLGLTTNLGGAGQFDNSRTVVSPLVGGRVRWNANPKLALVGTGTVSGFGISGLMQYDIQGGLDWMFSGNTTLGAGYRFGFTDYNPGRINLNVDQHGPYLNIGFRF